MNLIRATISALAYSILDAQELDETLPWRDRRNAVAAYTERQYANLPDYLILPFRVLTAVFSLHALLRTGRPFHRLANPERRAHLNRWKNAPIQTMRDFVRFHESMSLFALYSLLDAELSREPAEMNVHAVN